MNTIVMEKPSKVEMNGRDVPTLMLPHARKAAEKWKRMPTVTPSKRDGWIF